MKVLLISTSYPVSHNGSEAAGSFVQDFVNAVVENAQQIAVVAPIAGKTPHMQQNNITYFWFATPKLPLSLLSPKKPADWLPLLRTLKSGKEAVDKAVRDFQPDHIFALWALPSGYWARHAMKRYGIPYSIWALGSDIWTLGKTPIVKHYLKTVLKDAHHCFADGYKLAGDVTDISDRGCSFLPSTRQLPICGIPLVKSEAPYRLCFLGRWHLNKGIDILLEALHLLEDEDWKQIESIRIAGGGPLEKLVKQQVFRLQEQGRPISLSGFQDKYQAAELLTWTDYVIIPSRIESVPVMFSDAMQALRPVIAMPVGDLPLLINKYRCGAMPNGVTPEQLKHCIQSSINLNIKKFNQGILDAQEMFKLETISSNYLQIITNKPN